MGTFCVKRASDEYFCPSTVYMFGYLATFVLAVSRKEGRKEYHCEPKVAPRDYCFGCSLIAMN